MLNNVVLIGRIVNDLEIKKTGSGKSVLKFRIAVNRKFNKDEADFINCIAWDKTADFMSNYLNKGSLVSIEGRIETGNYKDKDGKTIYTTDVVVDRLQALESRKQREEYQNNNHYQNNDSSTKNSVSDNEPTLDITSDDLPF